jgi:hypothetical protein
MNFNFRALNRLTGSGRTWTGDSVRALNSTVVIVWKIAFGNLSLEFIIDNDYVD